MGFLYRMDLGMEGIFTHFTLGSVRTCNICAIYLQASLLIYIRSIFSFTTHSTFTSFDDGLCTLHIAPEVYIITTH